jgi:hypothetical protein
MRYRWYHPQIKRFLSPDASLGGTELPGSLNLYTFSGNNPITRVDPGGEIFNLIGALVGAAAGAVAGVAVQGVSDLISGRKPQWQDYAAAAVGGMVGGAILGACAGLCGPAALIAAGAAAGAIDGAGTVVIASALRGDEVNAQEAVTAGLIGAAVGGVTGGAGARFGGKAAKIAPKRAIGRVRFNGRDEVRTIARIGTRKPPVGSPPRKFNLSTREASLLNRVEYSRVIRYQNPQSGVRNFSQLAARDPKAANRLAATVMSRGAVPVRSRSAVAAAGRSNVNAGRRGVAGESQHQWRWAVDLERVGRPLPNHHRWAGTF